VAERDRLELSQPVATISAPKENRELVVEEPAAAAGDNRRTFDQACPLLLAAAVRGSSDAAVVHRDGSAD
jgi:hypothetical protein